MIGLDFEFGHEFVVCLGICALQVAHEAAAFADFFDETATGGEIFFVRFQVIGELFDFFAQDGDLDLWGAGVGGMGFEFLDDLLFLLCV